MRGNLFKKDGKWFVNHRIFFRKDMFEMDIPLHPDDNSKADEMEKEYNDGVESRFNQFPTIEFVHMFDNDMDGNKKITYAKIETDIL